MPNAGNWGVCRQPLDQDLEGPIFGGPQITRARSTSSARACSRTRRRRRRLTDDRKRPRGEYMMNSYLTCCSSVSPTQVSSAAGHFESGFGTTHPASGTSGQAPTTAPGTVEPLPEVEISSTGSTPGTTTAIRRRLRRPSRTAPGRDRRRSTTSQRMRVPVTVCIGFGALPAGTTEPTLPTKAGMGRLDDRVPRPEQGVRGQLLRRAVAFEGDTRQRALRAGRRARETVSAGQDRPVRSRSAGLRA